MTAKLTALYTLFRCANCGLAGFAAWVGAYTSGHTQLDRGLLLAVLTTVFITAGGNASNDIADLAVDAKSKPYRPLANGVISVPVAWLCALLPFFLGLVLAYETSAIHCAVACAAVLLLLLYNFLLKRVPLAGNMLVAVLSALPFVYGGLLSTEWNWSLIPFTFAFLIHLGRELLKSLEDKEGDGKNGIRTIAAYVSARFLAIAALSLFTLVIVLSVLPFFFGLYNRTYLAVSSVGVFLPAGIVIWMLLKNRQPFNFDRIHQLLKIEMLAGTIAILLAR